MFSTSPSNHTMRDWRILDLHVMLTPRLVTNHMVDLGSTYSIWNLVTKKKNDICSCCFVHTFAYQLMYTTTQVRNFLSGCSVILFMALTSSPAKQYVLWSSFKFYDETKHTFFTITKIYDPSRSCMHAQTI